MSVIEKTLKAQGLLRDYTANDNIKFTDVLELDLATVEPCLSGPKRPHDKVPVSEMKRDFEACVPNKAGFKGFGVPADKIDMKQSFTFGGEKHELRHGSVVLAAITSCTNTSNPDVMIAAGLVAQKALAKGLKYLSFYSGSRITSRLLFPLDQESSLDTWTSLDSANLLMSLVSQLLGMAV